VTPQDYEPRGFVPTELVRPRLPAGALSLQCGQVVTAHHGLGLEAGAVTGDVTGQDELDREVRRAEGEKEVTEGVLEEAMEAEMDEAMEASTEEGVEEDVDDSIVAEVGEGEDGVEVDLSMDAEGDEGVEADVESLLQPPSAVSCTCANTSRDPLMLLCRSCDLEQHAACYRILEQDRIPALHYCGSCSQKEGRPCTDRRLIKMVERQPLEVVAMTCLYRRLLAALIAEVERVDTAWIATRFDLEEETAFQMMRKAESGEVLGSDNGGLHLVNRGQPLQVSLKKYLGVTYEVGGGLHHL
jgi:hypothetical protein